ncbi:transcriptional regulator [Acidovorax sp. Root267]|uniref:type II toxin-antitoxin system HipA family toxin YjjJ n=1 Tax=Acidovorax sp. Root267 TaxID=1736505 RepID=UPI00070D244C|nr:type II toxin-antitoxin system HipA family toxin YjjJ [Acidovorax sp. Root267]KRD21816.1 transcriptional regulator [Acidovorax sp. Root267]
MNRPTPHAENLLAVLRRHGGVATSAALVADLGVSQPTVSRALMPLVRTGQVRKVGAARSQRYLLPRSVAGVGDDIPIMRVNTAGVPAPFGRMVPLPGGAFWVDEEDGVSERHDSLPWFLADMRPQGFMGRNFTQLHPDLQLPVDPRHWSDDDVLRALALRGEDLPGNLLVGNASLERFHTLGQRLVRATSADDYPQLARSALQGQLPGSSAGGEQPKFCCITQGRSVIVKFSSSGDSPADQRTRDLLLCEHLALKVLGQAGLPAANTAVFVREGRVFLESERFDRCSPWVGRLHGPPPGRIGMVSLMVYDAQYVGEMDHWAATALRMQARGLLTPEDARALRLLEAYGVLIGNTDRHYGNISLVLVEDDWRLSPAYDVLPMLYMPIAGELVPQDLALEKKVPTAATLDVWPEAQTLALAFWREASLDGRISEGFRNIARAHAHTLQAPRG